MQHFSKREKHTDTTEKQQSLLLLDIESHSISWEMEFRDITTTTKKAKSKKLLPVGIRLLSDSEMKKLEFSPKIPRKKKVAL